MSAMNLTLHELVGWLNNARLVGDGAVRCARVHTDTRSLQAGDLFVALKGERFDAASFLPEAAARLAEIGQPYLYYEDMTGGHSGGVDNEQRARLLALQTVYLLQRLKD